MECTGFPIDQIEEENLTSIDLDALNKDSESEAESMVKIVTDLFYDEQFKKEHPKIYKRIEIEIETLRGLIKMRKSDEEAHDALLSAIIARKDNASLYRAMSEIQKTSIAITNKIHDTLDRLNNICAELSDNTSMENVDDESLMDGNSNAHRGTKSFIKDVLNCE